MRRCRTTCSLESAIDYVAIRLILTSTANAVTAVLMLFQIRRSYAVVIATFFVVLVMGCATAQLPTLTEADVEQISGSQELDGFIGSWEDRKRLENLMWPIATSSIEICKPVYSSGLYTISKAQIRREDKQRRDAITAHFDLSDGLSISHAIRGSAASSTGLREGQRIVGVNSLRMQPSNRNKFATLASDYIRKLTNAGDTFVLHLGSGSETTAVEVVPTLVCPYELAVEGLTTFNAVTNGRKIKVHRGILRYAESDTDVQFVLAHELAHNIERHVIKHMPAEVIGATADLSLLALGIWSNMLMTKFVKSFNSKDLEAEADYIALYLLARAGIDYSGSLDIWDRMVGETFGEVKWSRTHPNTAIRSALLRATHAEIEEKKRRGLPLLPNRK